MVQPNYIGGEWRHASEVIANINPSNTNDIVASYAQASLADVQQAIDAAATAFLAWSRSSPIRHIA
ncbi:aldehyde dehydrogenase family protein [Bosea sp. LC85]|uniref:aldehyde dehydrogenase family protein n=1 Tax=Bosea sp. LC85 TaxID=1502851 RepID=UPI0005BBC788|nr:aldehyde dehydrogenase family protein [Bosea sp. LC85]